MVYGAAEDFGSQEFDEAALETQIEQEVKQFNEKNASVPDSMELEDFDVSDNVAKVIFSFETSRDFAEYMRQYNRENDFVKEDNDGKKSYGFYLGDAEEYDGDRSIALEKPDKSGQKALEDVDGTLLLLTGNYQVQIEGTVDYVSGGCSVDGNTVSTPKDSQGYIIYH